MKNLIEKEGRYFEECGVVMLPVTKHNYPKENEFCICEHSLNDLGCGTRGLDEYQLLTRVNMSLIDILISKYKHLYITSDDEIKEGDWCIHTSHGKSILIKVKYIEDQGMRIMTECSQNCWGDYTKKIIATTDRSLTEVIQNHNDFDSVYNLPQPSHKFIKAFVKAGGIDKVLVEYEPLESIHAWDETKYGVKTDSHNTITIKPVEEKMYSRDEMLSLFEEALLRGNNSMDWIKKHL